MEDEHAKLDLLCELNVIEQVENVALTTVVQDAWDRGQELAVHGWVYGLDNGIVNDLAVTIRSSERVDQVYESSVKSRYEHYAPTSL
jgi:carbonic anhydrase